MHRRTTRPSSARSEAGFTIAEALLVGVVGLALVMVAVVSVGRLRSSSDEIDCRTELRALTGAVQRFQADVGRSPENTVELVNVGYLDEGEVSLYEVSLRGDTATISRVGATCPRV